MPLVQSWWLEAFWLIHVRWRPSSKISFFGCNCLVSSTLSLSHFRCQLLFTLDHCHNEVIEYQHIGSSPLFLKFQGIFKFICTEQTIEGRLIIGLSLISKHLLLKWTKYLYINELKYLVNSCKTIPTNISETLIYDAILDLPPKNYSDLAYYSLSA